MGKYASGKYAYAISDRSGLKFPYDEMVREWNGSLVHTSEFEPKQPQLEPKPVGSDPQALLNPRPQPASKTSLISNTNSTIDLNKENTTITVKTEHGIYDKVDNWGIMICLIVFLVHFEGFAIQETITTVLVENSFNWTEFDANYLFTGSGVLTMLVVMLVAFLTKLWHDIDYSLLMISLFFGLIGHASLVDWNFLFNVKYSEPQFLFGFAFITIAFSLGMYLLLL